MTVNEMNATIAHLKAHVKRAGHAVQMAVVNMIDSQVDQETIDTAVEAALIQELMPNPWNPAWDM